MTKWNFKQSIMTSF